MAIKHGHKFLTVEFISLPLNLDRLMTILIHRAVQQSCSVFQGYIIKGHEAFTFIHPTLSLGALSCHIRTSTSLKNLAGKAIFWSSDLCQSVFSTAYIAYSIAQIHHYLCDCFCNDKYCSSFQVVWRYKQ